MVSPCPPQLSFFTANEVSSAIIPREYVLEIVATQSEKDRMYLRKIKQLEWEAEVLGRWLRVSIYVALGSLSILSSQIIFWFTH